MNLCKDCSVELTEDNTYYLSRKKRSANSQERYLYSSKRCKSCYSALNKMRRDSDLELARKRGALSMRNRSQEKKLLDHARERAREQNVPFLISIEDIIIPEFCPVLGTSLIKGLNKPSPDHSPSLDKIIPELGYIPGNIWVISYRANRIKDNATLDELKSLVQALENIINFKKLNLVA